MHEGAGEAQGYSDTCRLLQEPRFRRKSRMCTEGRTTQRVRSWVSCKVVICAHRVSLFSLTYLCFFHGWEPILAMRAEGEQERWSTGPHNEHQTACSYAWQKPLRDGEVIADIIIIIIIRSGLETHRQPQPCDIIKTWIHQQGAVLHWSRESSAHREHTSNELYWTVAFCSLFKMFWYMKNNTWAHPQLPNKRVDFRNEG